MTIGPEPYKPINWHDWKDVAIRLGIPIGISAILLAMILQMIFDPALLQCDNPCRWSN